MDTIRDKLQYVNLPTLGILAFSLCSVNSIYHLLSGNALHPSPMLYAPAILVELVTAWSVAQMVTYFRLVTKSNLSKQDRRFYRGMLAAFVGLALSLGWVSVWANCVEFGNLALGFLFPLSSVGCAVGAALPEVTRKYQKTKELLAKAQLEERRRKEKEKERKAEERVRQERERQTQLEERKRQAESKLIASLGKAGATLEQYLVNPHATQETVAQELRITRQAVGQHLRKLESQGIIKRNGGGVEVILGSFQGTEYARTQSEVVQ